MLSLRYTNPYNASAGAAREGTIALYFSTAGAFVVVAGNGETLTGTAVPGTQIEFGPLTSFTTLPANTIGFLGR